MRIALPLVALVPLLLAPAAGAATLARVAADGPGLQAVGFELPAPATVTVDATAIVGGTHEEGHWWERFKDSWTGHGDRVATRIWLIDGDSRELRWEFDGRDSEEVAGRERLRRQRDRIELDAGRYELYLHALPFPGDRDWEFEWGDRDRDRDRDGDRRHDQRDFERGLEGVVASVEADGVRAGSYEPDGVLPGALLAVAGVGDGEYHRRGFALQRDTELRVYGLMEKPRGADEAADFGWIVDAATGERVWDMNGSLGRRAGGGSKNRLLDRRVELPAGRYVLHYGTDDSHSAEAFNTTAPNDPLAWGIQLLPAAEGDGGFSTWDVGELERADPLVDFGRARDGDFFERAFEMRQDGQLFVVAMGEAVDDGWSFVDYGWIVDASSGETVWEMTDRNTEAAGGASKNRIFEGQLRLPRGNYIAYYVADDSHSYRDWNAAAPFRPEAWGLRIWPGEGTGARAIRLLEEVPAPAGTLAEISRVGDSEHERERFELDREARVEIWAVGEGTGGDMYDYAWLEDAEDRVVWEMDYHETDHAGGARKNRQQRATLRLPAGRYMLHYRSDGSHSFEGWNDARPDHPLRWGVVVRQVD